MYAVVGWGFGQLLVREAAVRALPAGTSGVELAGFLQLAFGCERCIFLRD